MSRFAYFLRKAMPRSLMHVARSAKSRWWRLTHREPVISPLEDEFPWSSPDIWQRIVDYYTTRPSPSVFEYGAGTSSIHHIRNLVARGGTFTAVEHKPRWYKVVLHAIIDDAIRRGLTIEMDGRLVPTSEDPPVAGYDTVFRLSGKGVSGCTINLKLRPSLNRVPDTDGTLIEFWEYVHALTEPCDVVIIDGRARKACVNYAIDNNLLKPSGLLVLFEAGRGVDGWLNSPALTGTFDYQPEVQRMLALGGELVDGCGLDRWHNMNRRTPNSTAYSYPLEACFLRVPASDRTTSQ